MKFTMLFLTALLAPLPAVPAQLGAKALTGCLEKGDEADPFILTIQKTGERITVVGDAELPKHLNHTVKVSGKEEGGGRVFHATKVEHVADSCETNGAAPSARGPDGRSGSKAEGSRRDAVTAEDQGNGRSDRKTTQAIRKALSGDKSLSTYARNVKVITKDGAVTLRGPVRSEQERQEVETKAVTVAGAGRVVNELTVEPRR